MTTSNLPEQRRRDARPRPRRLPDPAGGDPRRRRARRCGAATGTSTPPPRTATSARSARRSATPACARDEVFIETKIWISDYGYDETLHAFEKSAAQARRRPDRPADPAPGAARRRSTGPSRPTGRWRRCSPTARSAPSASATSWSSTSHGCSTRRDGRARGQPDRGPPLLPAARGAGLRRRARHPHPGLVADRRHHVLPRRRHSSTLEDPMILPRSPTTHGKTAGPGDAALAPAAGPLGHPEVDASPERIAENFDVFDFELTADELAAIDALDTGRARRPRARGDHPRGLRPRHPRGLSRGG